MVDGDVARVLAKIDELGLEPSPATPGWEHMGAILADAVLQAGLNYRNVVYPRVRALLHHWPEAKTTSALAKRIAREDISEVLDWKSSETKKMRTLRDLVEFLSERDIETPETLREQLTTTEFRTSLLSVKGVGNKTVDYLAILTGSSDHAAIDIHLRDFIESAGVQVPAYEGAVEVLRAAADERGWSLRALDAAIWEYQSGQK